MTTRDELPAKIRWFGRELPSFDGTTGVYEIAPNAYLSLAKVGANFPWEAAIFVNNVRTISTMGHKTMDECLHELETLAALEMRTWMAICT